MKAALLLLLAACAAPSPIPSGEKPSWVSTPNGDLRFPPDRYVAAVGSVPVGQKPVPQVLAAVDDAARSAVASQLAAAVALGFDLRGAVKIEGRWRQGDTAYAWGVFDLASAQARQAAKVSAQQQSAAGALAQGDAALADKPADALRSFVRARNEAAAAEDAAKLLRALGGKPEAPPTQADAEARIAALVPELTLNVVEGDRQLAVPGKPLPQPIVFTAWLKGKRAAGLPVTATVPGGRASAAVVGDDGRGEVRVADAGQASAPVSISLDWAALGAPAGAAWTPAAGVTAAVLRKSVATTRVLVLAVEKALSSALAGALTKAGFPVQDGQPLLEKFGAARIAAMTDAQLRDAARRVADVVVAGSVAAGVHAVDVASGQELFRAPAGKGVSAALQAALVKSASEP